MRGVLAWGFAIVQALFVAGLALPVSPTRHFVAAYLAHADDAVRELAALALGESRLDAALAPLKEAWGDVLVGEEFRRTLLRAAAAHRSEAAFDWLLTIVAESRVPVALYAVEALAPYNRNAKLAQRLEAALTERGERDLLDRFGALWR